ncbi:MAG: DUF1559 domain-containing protein [Pirellulales bacterium]|jgi:prepilin-type processing-associated H-X9-DG protein
MSQSSEVPEEAQLTSQVVYQFRLVHLMYVSAMLGLSLALIGPWGIGPAIIVLSFWATVWFSKSTRVEAMVSLICMTILFIFMIFWLAELPPSFSFLGWVLLFSFIGMLAFVIISKCNNFFGMCFLISLWLSLGASMVQTNGAGEAARRMQCTNNLKQISLAFHNYHDEFGSFPPPYLADEDGVPMHSWRVLLLPYLEEGVRYKKYDFTEPWNGPSNVKLLDPIPDVYQCPSVHYDEKHKNCTCYLAIVGPDSVWAEGKTRSFRDIVDGTSNTLLMTEFSESKTYWLQPSDIEYQAAIKILSSNNPDIFKEIHPGGRNVVRVDGSVHFAPSGLVPEFWSSLVKIDDLKIFDYDSYEPQAILEKTDPWPIGNITRPLFFVVVMLLPLPWVWIRPKVAIRTDNLEVEE